MDTYYKFEKNYITVGLDSIRNIDSDVERSIIQSISNAEGGCDIKFEKLTSDMYIQMTEGTYNNLPFGNESYIVAINEDIIIYYTSPITRLYGLYAIKRHYTNNGMPCGIICNTPKVPTRYFRSYLPGKKTIESFKKLVDMLIAFGNNAIMLEIGGAMEYKRHPEISEGWVEYCKIFEEYNGKTEAVMRIAEYPKNALHPDNGEGEYLTYEELYEIVNYCRERHFEIIPEVPTLCHVDYILYKHPELAEYPNDFLPNNACPLNKDYQKIEEDILDEIIEVFNPKRINICHDESYVIGVCPECRKRKASHIFAEHITRLHDYLAERNVKTMIWCDGVLPIDHGGNEAWHRRYPWDGEWTVNIYDRKYNVCCFKYHNKKDWEETVARESDAVAWYVPEKACYKDIPKDIECINWMWSQDDVAEDILNNEGFTNVYGNFLATGFNHLDESIKKGVSGFAFSNWGRIDFEALQRTNSLFAIGYNAMAAWDVNYKDDRRKDNTFEAAQHVYRYLNYETLMKNHIEITHSTDAVIEHEFFHDGFVIVKEDFRMGDYVVEFGDGSTQNYPIYWGQNIGNCNIAWYEKSDNVDLSVEEGGYCAMYIYEPFGTTMPVAHDKKTHYKIVIPIDKDVVSVKLKANYGYNINIVDIKMKSGGAYVKIEGK